jgi:hypothetical protein
MSYDEFREALVKDGYIAENGKPLKCTNCESKDFKRVNKYYEMDYSCVVEYTCVCKDCDHTLGVWAYGSWQE